MAEQVTAIPQLKAEDCPIQVGFRHRKPGFDLFPYSVTEIGPHIRVGGGWVVPVRMRRLGYTRSALLRHFADGTKSGGRVERVIPTMWACHYHLKHSIDLPEVVADEDPGVLRLSVIDSDGFAYHLRLRGILGPKGADECIALGDGNLDEE